MQAFHKWLDLMKNHPQISIIMATRNSSETINDAIASINNQSFKNYELIVIDGESSDDTIGIIEKNAINLTKIVSEPDDGVYSALNKGIKLAKGEIIGILHSDDLLADSTILEIVAQQFRENKVQGLYGDLLYVKRSDINQVVRHWKSESFSKGKLFYGWMPPHPTLFIRRRWYDELGVFNTKYKIAADYLFMLQLFGCNDFYSIHIQKVFVKMRTGGISNKSLSNIYRKTKEDYEIIRTSKTGNILTLVLKNIRKASQLFPMIGWRN